MERRFLLLGCTGFLSAFLGTVLGVLIWEMDLVAYDVGSGSIQKLQSERAEGGEKKSAVNTSGEQQGNKKSSETQTTTVVVDKKAASLQHCRTGKAPLADSFGNRTDTKLRFRFERCALVGSSPVLRGKGKGFEIDTHDTVIRVNRVPQQKYYEDYGQRTDILFAGPGWHGHEVFTKEGVRVELMGQLDFAQAQLCSYAGGSACRFVAVALTVIPEHYPTGHPGWRPTKTAFPFLVQAEMARSAADGFRGFHTKQAAMKGLAKIPWPTNGFYAFVAFAPICTTLELFGFGGSGTADGHPVESYYHNLSYDHYLMERLAHGALSPGDWAGHGEGKKRWVEKHLSERGRRGCIILDKG